MEPMTTPTEQQPPADSPATRKGRSVVIRLAIAVVIGAVAGYAWHRLVGCSTGACPIAANPWTSTAVGAVLGLLAAGVW